MPIANFCSGTAFKMYYSSKSGTKKRSLRLHTLNLSYCELSKKGFKTLIKVCPDLQVRTLRAIQHAVVFAEMLLSGS
jgi:hypothetical protein